MSNYRLRPACFAAAMLAFALAGRAEAKLSKGDPAPPFELKSVSGEAISMQTLAGGGLAILTFLSLDSKPSRELAVSLDSLLKEHGKKGIVVVAVAADPADKLKDFAGNQSLAVTFCSDAGSAASEREAVT